MTRLAVGLVGVGHRGRNHARTLSTLPRVRLVAAADRDDVAQGRSENEWDIPSCSSLDSLLPGFDVDAVVISSPDATHFDLASAALQMNKDVLVEKPLAKTPSQARTLHEQAAGRDRILAVGHSVTHYLTAIDYSINDSGGWMPIGSSSQAGTED